MPSLALAMVMLLAGFVYAIFALVFGILKSSEPYREAVARATSSPQVMRALGTPIDDGFLVSGNVRTNGGSGQASLEIPISGPQGKARIYLDAAKSGGRWTYSILEVAVDGRTDGADRSEGPVGSSRENLDAIDPPRWNRPDHDRPRHRCPP